MNKRSALDPSPSPQMVEVTKILKMQNVCREAVIGDSFVGNGTVLQFICEIINNVFICTNSPQNDTDSRSCDLRGWWHQETRGEADKLSFTL